MHDVYQALQQHRSECRVVTPTELALVATWCTRALPDDYIELLDTLGACTLYVDPERGTAALEVLHPMDVTGDWRALFDDPETLWRRVLPVLSLNRAQELGVYLWHEGEWRFIVVAHDEHPDDWVEAVPSSPSLLDLLTQLVDGAGVLKPH